MWDSKAFERAVLYPQATIYEGVVFEGTAGTDIIIGDGVVIYPGAFIGKLPRTAGIVPGKLAHGPTIIGEGSVIGANAVIYRGTTIGENVLIGDGVTIRENCRVGERSVIGNNSTIQNDAVIGRRVRIVDLSHITAGVVIGDDVFWSVGVLSMNDNRDGEGLKPPSVEQSAFIGGGAILLPGVQIRDGAVVAAGSVVTKNVPSGTRVQGVPARPYPTRQYDTLHDLSYDGTPLLPKEPEE